MPESEFEIPVSELELTPAPLVFQGEQLSPSPFHFLFTGEDRLQLESWNSVSGVTLSIQGRVWEPKTGIRTFAQDIVPNTDRTIGTSLITFGIGYLLNCVVFASAGSPRVGQTFISLHVVRGSTGALTRLATLLQGYVTRSQELAFPGSPVVTSEEGGGVIRTITGSNPAANSEWSETVPTGARWHLQGVSARLVASAAAGNRSPALTVVSGGVNLGFFPIPSIQVPSESREWYWWNGTPYDVQITGAHYIGGLPNDLIVLGGETITTATNNFQAGDDWQAPTLRVREWLEAT